MSAPIVTVDSLLEDLKKLSDAGYGDMKIKCADGYLREDEIGYNYLTREVLFRGNILNTPAEERLQKFMERIDEAIKELYRTDESEVWE